MNDEIERRNSGSQDENADSKAYAFRLQKRKGGEVIYDASLFEFFTC